MCRGRKTANPKIEGVAMIPEWARLAFAGALAGTFTKTSVAPMERVKMLMQLQSQREAAGGKAFSGSAISLAKRILANEGYRVNLKHHSRVVTIDSSLTAGVVLLSLSRQALYRGNGANVVRIIPNYGLKFMFNDTFKNIVKRPGQQTKDLSVLQLLSCRHQFTPSI